MSGSALVIVVLATACCAVAGGDATPPHGRGRGAVVVPSPRSECSEGTECTHHDSTFESAYCWECEGVQPPFYGAFGEGYDLGSGTVLCASYWVCQLGLHVDTQYDLYVWAGGVSREPGEVLMVVPGIIWQYVPVWPEIGQNDFEIGLDVSDEFAVGVWMDWSEGGCDKYLGADLNGPGGHPWTCVAPGLEWPSGWQDPSIVWGPTKSMGIGVYFEPRDPASVDELPDGQPPRESPTWGRIKALFHR